MPIARLTGEDVFLPVTAQMVVSVPEIVCISKIVSIPNSVSIAEVASGISLVPHACDRGISAVRESRETIPLIDRHSGVWTRTGNRYSILID
jgi:hypothetical protein